MRGEGRGGVGGWYGALSTAILGGLLHTSLPLRTYDRHGGAHAVPFLPAQGLFGFEGLGDLRGRGGFGEPRASKLPRTMTWRPTSSSRRMDAIDRFFTRTGWFPSSSGSASISLFAFSTSALVPEGRSYVILMAVVV